MIRLKSKFFISGNNISTMPGQGNRGKFIINASKKYGKLVGVKPPWKAFLKSCRKQESIRISWS